VTKIESSVKNIPYSQEKVFNRLSDLNNLEEIKDKIPDDKIKDLQFDTDTVSFEVSPVGRLAVQIIERDPYKCIKFETTTSPVPFNLWIQIVPVSEEECKIKLTAGLDINPIMKAMIQKPIEDGLEKLTDVLTQIPY